MALIGDKYKDKRIVGRYIAVAQYFRNRLLVLGALVLLVIFYFVSNRYDWGLWTGFSFWFFIMAAFFFGAQESFYDPILALQHRVKERYVIWNTGEFLRLLVIVVAAMCGLLSVTVALAATAVDAIFSSVSIIRKARSSIEFPPASDPLVKEKKEALALALPKLPETLFFVVKGQITIFLISIFGQYGQIASIGALSKLAALYLLPKAFNTVLMVPWFSKLSPNRVLRGYAVMTSLYMSFGLSLIAINYFYPQLFLWILGPAYHDLGYELFLFSISSLFALLGGLNYVLTTTRKWVYYWAGPVSIVSYLVIFTGFLIFVDLSVLSNVIMLSVMSNLAHYLLYQFVFFVGYSRSRKEMPTSETN